MKQPSTTTISILKRFFYRNEGRRDRLARSIVGLVLIILGIVTTPWLVGFGAWVIFTALISWCPLYSALGVSTCPVRKARG